MRDFCNIIYLKMTAPRPSTLIRSVESLVWMYMLYFSSLCLYYKNWNLRPHLIGKAPPAQAWLTVVFELAHTGLRWAKMVQKNTFKNLNFKSFYPLNLSESSNIGTFTEKSPFWVFLRRVGTLCLWLWLSAKQSLPDAETLARRVWQLFSFAAQKKWTFLNNDVFYSPINL